MIWLVDPARPSQKPGYNLLTFVLLLKQRCFDLKKWFGQPSDSVKIQNSNLKPDQIKKKKKYSHYCYYLRMVSANVCYVVQ